jgi:ABC-type transport system substrate-binding protein
VVQQHHGLVGLRRAGRLGTGDGLGKRLGPEDEGLARRKSEIQQLLDHALRIGLAADVTSLDPHHINIGSNNNALWNFYDALTHVNAEARLVPGLAESWKATDTTTWEFRLRRGVRFHDGSELTPDDVIASIERARASEKAGGQFGAFTKAIVEMKVVKPNGVVFRTATPYAMLPYDLNSIFIISRKALAATTEDFNAARVSASVSRTMPRSCTVQPPASARARRV